MVFSITSRNSFERILQINDSLKNVLGEVIDIPRVLVGTMLDYKDQRQVSFRVSESSALRHHFGRCFTLE